MNYEQELRSWFADKEEELVEAIRRLVAIRSVKEEAQPGMPFGPGPAAALAEGLKLAGEMGLRTQNHENYVGTVDLNGEETALHILAHLDVVGEGTGWDTDPYTVVQKDGMIYGRGTDDDKGPAAASLLAMRAVKELGIPLKYNVRLILGTDEESGSGDIAYYYARNSYAPFAFSPDGSFPVVNIEKGQYCPEFGGSWPGEKAIPRVCALRGGIRTNVVPPEAEAELVGLDRENAAELCEQLSGETGADFSIEEREGRLVVTAHGKNAHASTPEEGVNAITALLALLKRLPLADCRSTRVLRGLAEKFPHGDLEGRALNMAQKDELSGALTVNLAFLTLGETGLTGKVDCRVPLCADDENCVRPFEAAMADCGLSVTGCGERIPGHHTPASLPQVEVLLRCYEHYTGLKGECLSMGGGTYVHDIPNGVAFGCGMPGFNSNLHGANEHACVKDLLISALIFAQCIVEICGE